MAIERLSNNAFDKMIIASIDSVDCYTLDGDLLFTFDQVKSGEISSEADVVYAEGRQGVQLAAFDRNKTATFTCENGYIQAGALAVQLGTDVVNGAVTFDVLDRIETNTATATLSSVVKEIKKVYRANSDWSKGEALDTTDYSSSVTYIETKDTTYVSGKTYYTKSGSSYNKATITAFAENTTYYEAVGVGITFNTGIVDTNGSKFIVVYESETATGKTIINSGDNFSRNVKLVINFVAQEPCDGTQYLMQCVFGNAKVSSSFSLSAGDDPAVQNFEATALLDVCSASRDLFTIKMV